MDVLAPFVRLQAGQFRRPSRHDSTLDRALEAVCLKAVATGPEDRYATPKALADDLDRWLADEPVTAWREPFSRRARRASRRSSVVNSRERTLERGATESCLIPRATELLVKAEQDV